MKALIGWAIVLAWLASWIVIARYLAKKTQSKLESIGGAFPNSRLTLGEYQGIAIPIDE